MESIIDIVVTTVPEFFEWLHDAVDIVITATPNLNGGCIPIIFVLSTFGLFSMASHFDLI